MGKIVTQKSESGKWMLCAPLLGVKTDTSHLDILLVFWDYFIVCLCVCGGGGAPSHTSKYQQDCLRIQLNSNTIYLKTASDFTS